MGPKEGVIRFAFELNEDWQANYGSDLLGARVDMNCGAARETL